MSWPRFFYASPMMLRRWVAGSRHPGLWFVYPNGRARLVVPTGKKVQSVYGPKESE